MNQQNITPSSTERFVPAQYICSDGTIETYPEYLVSNFGRVASMKRHAMKILNQGARTGLGHLQVTLCVNGKRYFRSTHRLVLSSFRSELWSKDTNEVDHIDRNAANNHLDNLRWTDRNGNNANKVWNQLKRIRVTHLSDGHIELFDNMWDCSRAFGKQVQWCSYIIYKRNGFNAKYNILIEKIS